MLRFYKQITMTLLVMLILPLLSQAQPGMGPIGRKKHEKRREKVRQMKKMKLLEVLDLTSEQSKKFMLLYNEHEKSQDETMEKLRDISIELKKELKKNPSSQKSSELVETIISKRVYMGKNHDKFFADMKKILDTEQYNKLVYFEEVFEREVMKAMWNRERKHRKLKKCGMGKGTGDFPPLDKK